MADRELIFENDELYDKLIAANDVKTIQNVMSEFDINGESEEFDEEALNAVSGGYSRSWESTKIVAVTYYEMKKYGKAKTYSNLEISEAIAWVERNSTFAKQSLKETIEGIKLGLKISKGFGLI